MADETTTTTTTTEAADDKTPLTREEFKQFAAGLTALQASFNEVGSGMKELIADVRAQRAAGAQSADTAGDDLEEAQVIDDTTLETMPRRQFMSLLQDNFKKVLEGSLKPLSDKIDSASVSSQAAAMRVDAEKLMVEHPDFLDFKDEMTALSNAHPTLNIRQIYNLARMENPTKSTELDKKYGEARTAKEKAAAKAEEEKAAKAAAAARRRPFALSPQGGTEETRNQRMAPADAAKAAWDATVAQLGFTPFQ